MITWLRTAAAEQSVGIIEQRAHARRAYGRVVDHTADCGHSALQRIDLAVGHAQLHLGHRRDSLLERAFAAVGEREQIALGQREVGIHLVVVAHRGQRLHRRGRRQRAFAVGYRAHHAVRRRGHHRICQILAGVDQLSLSLRELCLGALELIVGHLIFILAYDVLVVKLLLGVGGHLGGRHCGLGCVDSRHGLIHGSLKLHLVENEECLALLTCWPSSTHTLVMKPVTCGRIATSLLPLIRAGKLLSRSDVPSARVIVAMLGAICCICC